MQSLVDIKHRMKGIAQTRQITNAMNTISIAKMRKSMQVYEANQVFFEKIRTTIKDIVTHSKDITHRYLTQKKGNRSVYIVIASDKGLAGGYNNNVLKLALQEMKEKTEKHIFTVGHMAKEFFEHRGMTVDGEFIHISLEPSFSDAMHIVDSIIALYDMNMMDDVYIVYTTMINSSVVKPAILKLLPLSEDEMLKNLDYTEKEDEYYKVLVYDPSPEIVLEKLVPQYLAGVIYGCLVNSVASEHSSRMLAMSKATKNATEILEKLNLTYNRARQEKITNELTEIITSAQVITDLT